MTNDEIVGLAKVMLRSIREPDDEMLLRIADATIGVWRHNFTPLNWALIVCAAKLLDGRPYSISTDSATSVQRYRSLARYLGAEVVENRANWLGWLFAAAGIESPYNIVIKPAAEVMP